MTVYTRTEEITPINTGVPLADAFLSYSRVDLAFALRLVTALVAAEQTVWFDKNDIPPTAEWLAEVNLGIDSANNFLFLLTPDSVASEACREELERAIAGGKRLIPLCHRKPPDATVDKTLVRHNYIFFTESDDFDAAVKTLVAAMHTNFDWVHAHTRLQVRAQEWQNNHQDASYLLSGTDLKAGETWLAQSAGQPVQPTPLQNQYLIACRQAATRRSRLVFTVLAVFAVVATGLAIYAFLQRNVANTQRDHAEQETRIASANLLATTAIDLKDSQLDLASLLSLESLRLANTYDTRNAELTLFQSIPALDRYLNQSKVNAGFVESIAFAPNGKYFATGNEHGDLQLFSTTNWLLAWIHPGSGSDQDQTIAQLAFSPNGSSLALLRGDGPAPLELWHLDGAQPSLAQIQFHDLPASPQSIAYNRDGSLLAVCGSSAMQVYAMPSMTPLRPAAAQTPTAPSLWKMAAFSPADTNLLAMIDNHGRVRMEDARTARLIDTLDPPPGKWDGEFVLAFSADGKRLASTADNGAIAVWTIHSANATSTHKLDGVVRFEKPGIVMSLAFSPDSGTASSTLLAVSNHGSIEQWDTTTLAARANSSVPATLSVDLHSTAWSPDGQHFITGQDDGRLLLWDFNDPTRSTLTFAGNKYASRLVFSNDGNRLAAMGGNNSIAAWQLLNGSPVNFPQPAGRPPQLRKIAFSPTGQSLLIQPAFSGPQCWDFAHRAFATAACSGLPNTLWQPMQAATAIAGSGSSFAAVTPQGIEISSSARSVLLPWAAKPLIETFLAISPDGRHVAATTSNAVSATLFTISDAAPRSQALESPASELFFDLQFNRTGTRLAGSSFDGLFLWDTTTGKRIGTGIEQNRRTLLSASFTPDDARLALAFYGGLVQIVDTETQRLLGLPLAPGQEDSDLNSAAAFSPDGKRLAYASAPGTVTLWNADPQAWAARACSVANRNLTLTEWHRYMGNAPYRRTCPELPDGEGVLNQ